MDDSSYLQRRAGIRDNSEYSGSGGYADCGCTSSDSEARLPSSNPGRSWEERRRDPRVNGADIYVVRVSKSGLGNAKPCWRGLEWCRWAGVKRVFHWDDVGHRFEMVKVNDAERENYETRADTRLFAGLVRVFSASSILHDLLTVCAP